MSDGSFPIYSPRRNLQPSPSKAMPNTAKGVNVLGWYIYSKTQLRLSMSDEDKPTANLCLREITHTKHMSKGDNLHQAYV